jgi:hypothetical protein
MKKYQQHQIEVKNRERIKLKTQTKVKEGLSKKIEW